LTAELLKIDSIVKRFGGLLALDNVSLHFDEGKIYGLIGPNGSGKTTLLNLASGILKPNAGSISFRGHAIAGKSPEHIARLGLGRTFQIPRVFSNLSVRENVRAPLSASKQGKGIDDELLSIFGLEKLEDTNSRELSYSHKKLLEIARMMTVDPSLIMLDEPMAGLDIETLQTMSSYIRELNKKYGKTLIVVEHNLEELFSFSDYIFVLDHGTLVYEGTPEGVKESKAVSAAYFGPSGSTS
jgi:neutral amino acid transport system ATP-binding protein